MKRSLSLLILLFISCSLHGFRISLEIPDIINLKISLSEDFRPVTENFVIGTGNKLFSMSVKKTEIQTGPWTWNFNTKGGGGIKYSAENISVGTALITNEESDSTDSWFYRSRNLKSDRFLLTEIKIKTENAAIDIENRTDFTYGSYTDLTVKYFVNIPSLKLEFERRFRESITDSIKMTSRVFNLTFRKETGPRPVYGGTARTGQTETEASVKLGPLTLKTLNVSQTKEKTGVVRYSDFSLKLTSPALEFEARTRLNRTAETTYAFLAPSFSMKIKCSKKTGNMTFGLEINSDRSIRISLSSEISLSGSGKHRFTCNIDT